MIAAILLAFVFGCAAACGVALAQALCAHVEPLEGGPPPQNLHPALPIAVTALVGFLLGLHHATPLQTAIVALLCVPLTGAWYADARKGVVPDAFTLVPLAAVALEVVLHHTWFVAVSAAVTGGAFTAAALISRGRGMGWGDAKLAALAGALLGLPWSVGVLGLACFAATVVSVVRTRGTQPIAFAPYIVIAILADVGLTVHA
ncbi:MAG TPA: prepilin peptidase [Candidatus Baltobacteraceae bacterium]|nr:prepilin peptidase [Candidatus Baltobacteraceae bacterium]